MITGSRMGHFSSFHSFHMAIITVIPKMAYSVKWALFLIMWWTVPASSAEMSPFFIPLMKERNMSRKAPLVWSDCSAGIMENMKMIIITAIMGINRKNRLPLLINCIIAQKNSRAKPGSKFLLKAQSINDCNTSLSVRICVIFTNCSAKYIDDVVDKNLVINHN